MDRTLSALVPQDVDLPERAWRLDVFERFRDGTIYELLPYEFHEERTQFRGEYIPIAQRAPSVRYGLCSIVVNDSVAMVFADGRFPTVDCGDDEAAEATFRRIAHDTRLAAVLLDAARIGAVGSVAIEMRVLKGRLFFRALRTHFLTPIWKSDAPDIIDRVIEQYKVKGRALSAAGYAIAEKDFGSDFWFMREWNEQREIWYLPKKVVDKDKPFAEDDSRTVVHNLGFVPMVWIKNLPGGDAIDGECTFRLAIETSIEIDYQLSQAGRGLKYSSNPTLVLQEGEEQPGKPQQSIVAGDALLIPKDGDARLLEITGGAAGAVVDYVRELRKLALESVGGSRADSDKLSAATSGRAMELMNQPLINLADKLRTSYGAGLLELLEMTAAASRKLTLLDRKGRALDAIAADAEITLRWPPFFAPTAGDRQADAVAISALRKVDLLSDEAATKAIAADYDIGDIDIELKRLGAQTGDAHD